MIWVGSYENSKTKRPHKIRVRGLLFPLPIANFELLIAIPQEWTEIGPTQYIIGPQI